MAEGQDRAALPLEASHGSIGVDADHQEITELSRAFQVTNVPCVHQIEAAIGEDDLPPATAGG